jgi:hypothetical protein
MMARSLENFTDVSGERTLVAWLTLRILEAYSSEISVSYQTIWRHVRDASILSHRRANFNLGSC